MSRADDRLSLGAAAVFSPSRAAELLGGREAEVLEWLRVRRLIRKIPGLDREVVIWGEVLEAIRMPDLDQPAPERPRGSLPRKPLGRRG
jgi:hypothetical protein